VSAEAEAASEGLSKPADFSPEWGEHAILCVGARGSLDDVAATILAQLLRRRGIGAHSLTSNDITPENLSRLDMAGVRIAFLSYMNEDSITHAKYLIRRLRRRAPATRIMVGFWSMTSDQLAQRKVVDETRADLVTGSLTDALNQITSLAASESVKKSDETAKA
jgi:hypothetical protein